MLFLSVLLWFLSGRQFLPVIAFMSIFQAASVVNLSLGSMSMGVNPSLFLLVVFLITKRYQTPNRKSPGQPLRSAAILLSAFVAYAAASAFICPVIFSGVPITNPKFGVGAPLQWGTSHLTQLCYLLLAAALYGVAAYYTSSSELIKSVNWFVAGAVLASLITFYQYAAFKTGLPFPKEFLDTNPTYVIYDQYEINGFLRVNSTFTEASAAAFTLSMALAIAIWRLFSAVSLASVVYTTLLTFALMLTLSSSGYLCLVYLLAAAIALYVFRWRGNHDSRVKKTLLAVPALLIFLALLSTSGFRQSFSKLAHTVILDKQESSSYQKRTQDDRDALTTAADTYGLGAGWGMCRGSSFIPTLLANAGIPGFVLFFAFCFEIMRPVLRPRRIRLPIHGAVLFTLSVALLDLFISGPEATQPILWLLFAIAARLAVPRRLPLAVRTFPHRRGSCGTRIPRQHGVAHKMKIHVNGRFRSQKLTGLQRYAHEVTARLGSAVQICQPGGKLSGWQGHLWRADNAATSRPPKPALESLRHGAHLGISSCCSFHDIFPIDSPEWYNPVYARWHQFLMRSLAKTATHVIAVSQYTQSRLVNRLGVRPSRISVIPEGVHSAFSEVPPSAAPAARQALNLPSEKYFLSVGSLEPRKNLRRLVIAWAEVVDDLPPDLWLVVAGSGSSIFKNDGLQVVPKRVFMTGYVPENHLHGLYSGSQAFLYPSLGEGFGLPPLEAMAAGVPVITSSLTALPEVCSSAALYVDPTNVSAIAGAIKLLSSEVTLRLDLAERGRRRAAKFTWDKTAAQTLEVLQTLAQRAASKVLNECKSFN